MSTSKARSFRWPKGKRCACSVTFDMDAESLIHIEHPNDGYTRISAKSMLAYGPKVGIPRILRTYRDLGIRQTFFVPAWCIEEYPATIDKILFDGHEIGHHGYLHENPRLQSRDQEAEWLDRGIEVIQRATGRAPRGWRAPLYNFSPNSAELLAERGFSYDASLMGDDVPYLIEVGEDKLVELPSHWGLDDWPQFVQSFDLKYMMPIRAPEVGARIFEEEFEAAYEAGSLWIPVLHPFVTGRLARWRIFARLVERIVAMEDVWVAPMEEIADYVHRCASVDSEAIRIEENPARSRRVDPLSGHASRDMK